MRPTNVIQIAVGVALLLVLGQSLYTVHETEQIIITQFGEPVGEPVVAPGLHFKLPFIQRINVVDKRFLEWDGNPNQVPTRIGGSSGSTPTRAGASPTRCCTFCGCETSGSRNRGLTTSSTARRATRWLVTT